MRRPRLDTDICTSWNGNTFCDDAFFGYNSVQAAGIDGVVAKA